MSEIVFLKRH